VNSPGTDTLSHFEFVSTDIALTESIDVTKAHRLPLELWFEIAVIAAGTSQAAYCQFSLISRRLRDVIEKNSLPHLPIRLESTSAILKFHTMLNKRPKLAQHVRYLWMRSCRSKTSRKDGYSHPTTSTWLDFNRSAFEELDIIHLCTNLRSLACSFPVVFLCYRFSKDVFCHHTNLTNLTLFENWNLWPAFLFTDPGERPSLFSQITELTLHDALAPNFAVGLFPRLGLLSCAFPPQCLQAWKASKARAPTQTSSAALGTVGTSTPGVSAIPLPQTISTLPSRVKITFNLPDRADLGIRRIVAEDGQVWTLRVGKPRFFEWWVTGTGRG